jgi:gamma-glutamyl-gamma-aminobutyrate hydrolase PuuD
MNYLDIIAPAITIIAVACYITQIITRLGRKFYVMTAQRDMLAEAIRKHKASLPFAPDFCDVELYEALQSLTPKP